MHGTMSLKKVKCVANTFGSKTVIHIKWTLCYYFKVTDLIMSDLLFILQIVRSNGGNGILTDEDHV